MAIRVKHRKINDRIVTAVDRSIQMLLIYKAAAIQTVHPDTASARLPRVCDLLSLVRAPVAPASSGAITPHCAVRAAAGFCTCAEPKGQAGGLDTDRARATKNQQLNDRAFLALVPVLRNPSAHAGEIGGLRRKRRQRAA